ncbi:hypothetical protein SY83_19405 [Paenibacillus swuensis]|uniref:Uncharacterized protein n=1 Tax=Paenibacillus swuensis TaxID=1178515 RepID=A0A172TMA4_9BACL|nr:hypothetical protein SY83_19405 [Paenibacillus swuensis]
MRIMLVIAAVIFIGWKEYPGLISRREGKEIGVFAIFLIAGGSLSGALAMHIELPSPLLWVEWIISPIQFWLPF